MEMISSLSTFCHKRRLSTRDVPPHLNHFGLGPFGNTQSSEVTVRVMFQNPQPLPLT